MRWLFFTISVLFFLFQSCKKEDKPLNNKPLEEDLFETRPFTLKGKLYDSCGGLSVSNQILYFWAETEIGKNLPAQLLGIDSSNEQGEFVFIANSLPQKNYSIRIKDLNSPIARDIYLALGKLEIVEDNQEVEIGVCYRFGIKKAASITINNQKKFLGARVILNSTNSLIPYSDTIIPHPDSTRYTFQTKLIFNVKDLNNNGNFASYSQIFWGNQGVLSDTTNAIIHASQECSGENIETEVFRVK